MTGRAGWVDVNGAALRYRLDGEEGPRLVLVHEMGGTIETWVRVVGLLRYVLRILRFDTRGAGLSEKIAGKIRTDDLADDLAALLDALGIDEPVAVAGCAVGAAVALDFAARHPARAASVIAMNPAIGVTAENRVGLLDRADRLGRLGTRAIVEESLALGYPQSFRDADPEHFALFKARWLANDPESLKALFLMLSETDLTPILPEIGCPVLGISGRHDPLRPTSYVRAVLAHIRDTSLVVIEAGHHMADQAPAEVAAAIREFLFSQGKQAGARA